MGQGFQGVNCGVAGNAVAHWASNNTNHNITPVEILTKISLSNQKTLASS
jgi:hypothetical protein